MVEKPGGTGNIQIVAFRLRDVEYGFDVSMVKEIIKMRDITPIPHAPPFVEGIINLRGQLTSILDLRKRFDLEANFDDDTRIIIIDSNNRPLGVIVDSVSEVLTVSTKDMESVGKEKDNVSKRWHTDFVKGVIKLESRLLLVLDFKEVVRGSINNSTEIQKREVMPQGLS